MSATRLFSLCWAGILICSVVGVDKKEVTARKLTAEAAAGKVAGKWPFSVSSDAEDFPINMNSDDDVEDEESKAHSIRRGEEQESTVITSKGDSEDYSEEEEDDSEDVAISDDAFEVDDARSNIITDDSEEDDEYADDQEDVPATPTSATLKRGRLAFTARQFPKFTGCTPTSALVGPSYAPQLSDSSMSSSSVYNGRPFSNNASFSRMDDVTTSYCGGLYWDNTQTPPGYLAPNGTCYVIYNFGNLMWLQGFVTAGRNDKAATWVTNFSFYISTNGVTWSVPVNSLPIYPGNVDAVSTETNIFSSPVRSAWAMIVGTETESTYPVPAGSTVKRCCFRAELIGCYAETTTSTTTTETTTTAITSTTTTTIAQKVVGITVAPVTTPKPTSTVKTTPTTTIASNITDNASNVSNKSAAYVNRGFTEVFTLLMGLVLSSLGSRRYEDHH